VWPSDSNSFSLIGRKPVNSLFDSNVRRTNQKNELTEHGGILYKQYSQIERRRSQVVRQRSAKPLFSGSNPLAASKKIRGLANQG
jgi:hypothetical protein